MTTARSAIFFTIASIIGLVLLWYLSGVLLMLFGSLLWAIFLVRLSRLAQRWIPLGHRLLMTIILILVIVLLTLSLLAAAPQLTVQARQFVAQVIHSWGQVQGIVTDVADQWIVSQNGIDWSAIVSQVQRFLWSATGLITTVGGGFFSVFVVLYVGTLVAFAPDPYIDGFLSLFPSARESHMRRTVRILADTLWRWLLGRIGSMIVIGILTWIGLIGLKMPLSFFLALIAGLLSFIPNIGIIVATTLALLIAFPLGWTMMLWVLALYVLVQIIEGNLITPFIEQHTVRLPAGLIIMGQIIFGFLFGILGIMFATPMLVAVIVLTRRLYVERIR